MRVSIAYGILEKRTC